MNQNMIGNRILRSLPASEWHLIQPHLQAQEWPLGTIVQEANAPVDYIAFPQSGLLSSILISQQNIDVEVGINGTEGQSGALAVLADTPALLRVIVQAEGDGLLLPASIVRAYWSQCGVFQRLLLQHSDVFAAQSACCALCNRLHTVEERLGRWLLMVQDRLQSDRFALATDFVASMLGIRASGVPIAMGLMQQAGIIRRTDRDVIILDRPQLEASACECYHVLRTRYKEWENNLEAAQSNLHIVGEPTLL